MPRWFTLFIGALFVGILSALRADVTSPVAQTIPTQTVARAGGQQTVNLGTYITDPNVPGTAVRVTATVGNLGVGNIDIALTDAQTPITVTNFLAYINAGAYANNIVHRSVPGFIIQDGGYYFFTDASNNVEVGAVPTFAPIQNEFGISNTRGTVAMAKVGGDVVTNATINSATSQWFINMSDNSANLDNQNGGFTVFGRVIGTGMQVADIINNLPTYSNGTQISADWSNLPLTTSVAPPPFLINTFVITSTAVVPAVTYTASSNNTALVTTSVSGNTLTLTSVGTNTGTANITITATDLEGSQLQTTFSASILDTYTNWKTTAGFANLTVGVAGETADPDGDGVPNLSEYAFGGDPVHALPRAPGLPATESGGGVTFYVKQVAALSYEVDESTNLVNWTKVWSTSDGFSNAAVAVRNILSGFDQVTIRNPSPPGGNIHFWRVVVSRTL